MVKRGLGHRVTAGLRWATLSRLATQVVTWSATLMVVRLLAPADYGLAAMAAVLAGYLAMWSELGFSVTLIQKRTVDEATLRSVFAVLLILGVGLCILTWLVSPLIALAFAEPRIAPLARVVSLNFLVMPFAIIPYATLSINMNFRALSIIGLCCATVGAIVTLLLAYLGFGAYALVLGPLAIAIARAVALNSVAPFLKRPSLRTAGLRDFGSFSGNVMLTRTVWYWYTEADNLIVGRLLGANTLGLYSLGRQLALMPMERAAEIVNMIALPAYSSVNNDLARVRDAYLRTIGLVATVTFPLFWGLALVAKDLVGIILGPKWIGAIAILQILCLVMPIRTIGTLAAAPLMAIGRADRSLHFIVVPAVLVPLCLLAGVHWGITGVASAWALAYPIAFLVASNWTKSAFQASLREILSPIVAPALSAGAMVAAVAAVMIFPQWAMPPLAGLVLKILLGALFYVAALAVVSKSRFVEALTFARALLNRSPSTE